LHKLLVWAADFYQKEETWRYPHLIKRIHGCLWFLPSLSLASLLWFFTLSYRQFLDRLFSCRFPNPVRLAIRIGASIVLGVLAVFLAIYFSNFEWNYYGKPLWDNYCGYASLIYSWLFTDTSAAGARLLAYVNWDYHSNAPAGPFIVAIVMKISGWPPVQSFRFTCGFVTVATFCIVWRVLKSNLHADWEISAASMFLLASNMAVVISFIFPFTDPFVMLWATVAWSVGLRCYQSPSLWKSLLLLLIVATGVLVKISLFTLLGLAPIWWLMDYVQKRNSPVIQSHKSFFLKKAFEMLIFTFLSLSFVFCLSLVFDFPGHFFSHIGDIHKFADSYLPFVVLSFFLTCGPFLPLLVFGRDRFSREDRMLLAWSGIYLITLWLSRGPGWSRYYLPVLPALAVVSVKGLSRIRTTAGRISLWVYVLEAAGLSYLGLWLGVHI
jgi:hypothetical protein